MNLFKSLFPLRLILILMIAPSIFSWANHQKITHTALSAIPDFETKMVVYETLDVNKVLNGMGVKTIGELCEKIKIRKEYAFEPRLGEIPGKPIPLIEVLATYSDEPDWGMDRELFHEEQYPELYGLDIAVMGGKDGTASQFFRHAHLPLDLLSPVLSLKAPYAFSSMGDANGRGALFVKLSQLAAKNNSPYWAARFLSCSLHYISDVSQPFHTSQVPTKQYLWMAFPTILTGKFIGTVIRIISYYHWAYERTIGGILTEKIGTQSQREIFIQALTDNSEDSQYHYAGMQNAVESAAQYSLANSGISGKESILFFPRIPGKIAEFDPKGFMDDAWWKEVDQRLKNDSAIRDHYLKTVENMFRYLGIAIRVAVQKELQ